MLAKVEIVNLRVLSHCDLELGGGLNGFFGGNGAGKTSLLEGCGLLGMGRSFRTARHGEIIGGEGLFTRVVGEILGEGGRLIVGVERRAGSGTGRINGRKVVGRSELARAVPVMPVDSDVYGLLWAGSRRRRRWLDWLLFHVEPGFGGALGEFEKARRQRNQGLRRGLSKEEMKFWDSEFVRVAMRVSNYRREIAGEVRELLQAIQKDEIFLEADLRY
ncbi:MAG: AAA family ATPase, partial [Deltaproteobacteria bacterium]|nr:AAA family ATPase [Deltaproteobacteria bacterium]